MDLEGPQSPQSPARGYRQGVEPLRDGASGSSLGFGGRGLEGIVVGPLRGGASGRSLGFGGVAWRGLWELLR